VVTVQAIAGTGVSELAAKMEPFAGCNCYYLLAKSISGEEEYVVKTLQAIKDARFNVIRMWAFNDGDGSDKLQKQPGRPDEAALKRFDWLLNKVEEIGGIKLMMTLTNCLPDYGGMQQYVRWSGTGEDFYHNAKAKQYYKDYISVIINRYKNRKCIHSWDICNEPRYKGSSNRSFEEYSAITNWIQEVAAHIKSLDPNHPVTVGSEGFFGPSSAAARAFANLGSQAGGDPYDTAIEGCSWLQESQIKDIDFVSIHSYGDQWLKGQYAANNSIVPAKQCLEYDERWLETHIQACKTVLGNKPLVLQEYNLPEYAGPGLRKEYFDYLTKKIKETDTPLIGTMAWIVAPDHTYNPNDEYALTPANPEWDALRAMCEAVNPPTRS